jgi:hypothetical protein
VSHQQVTPPASWVYVSAPLSLSRQARASTTRSSQSRVAVSQHCLVLLTSRTCSPVPPARLLFKMRQMSVPSHRVLLCYPPLDAIPRPCGLSSRAPSHPQPPSKNNYSSTLIPQGPLLFFLRTESLRIRHCCSVKNSTALPLPGLTTRTR